MALSLALGMGLFIAGLGIDKARPPRVRGVDARRRGVKSACRGCERRRAQFREHGIVTWGRYHARCARCYRTLAGLRN
jgi:hypothetical protein